jgi:alpha-L-fucosidase
MAKYSNTSPYFSTAQNNISLDFFTPRTITAEDDDVSYTIDRIYAYRPDLLAYDLYGTPVTIQLPKLSNLKTDLGI